MSGHSLPPPELESLSAAEEAILPAPVPRPIRTLAETDHKAGILLKDLTGVSKSPDHLQHSARAHTYDHVEFQPEPLPRTRPRGSSAYSSYVSPPATPLLSRSIAPSPGHTTHILVGPEQKLFVIPTTLLLSKSPYFASLSPANLSKSHIHPLTFPEADDKAFEILTKWFHHGVHALGSGPHDFHSMTTFLSLYIVADRFLIESLKNSIMDRVRSYYRRHDMTAPAFRLEHIYEYTDGPNKMREFLLKTAAWRALGRTPSFEMNSGGISDSVKQLLKKGGDFAVDYARALAELEVSWQDVRLGDDCLWHEHGVPPRCGRWSETD